MGCTSNLVGVWFI